MALGRESDLKLRRAFKDLDQIKADVVYPFLLECYSDYELGTITRRRAPRDRAAGHCLRFPSRCLPHPDELSEHHVRNIPHGLRKDRYVDSVKAHFLAMKSYRAFPTDAEFRDALTTSDLYNFRRRSYFLRVL